MPKGILVDVNTGDTTTEGRLQMYLVLGALACADIERMDAFVKHGQAIKGRNYMYANYKSFLETAPKALEGAGFSPRFIKAINWGCFTEKIFEALKTLRGELFLLEDDYDAHDCPCISVLVAQSIAFENLLEPVRKVNKDTQRVLNRGK